MDNKSTTETPQTRTKLTLQRGNFYFALGFALLAGLLVVVGLGVLGITSPGWFSISTAFAMAAIAITMLGVVSFLTLTTLRRTISLLNHHETALAEQATRHADLAAKVQSQWHAEQIIRDRNQDDQIAVLSSRKDGLFAPSASRAQRNGTSRAGVNQTTQSDPFEGGQVHPVIDVEGIGEHYNKLLKAIGIDDTQQLYNADTNYVADQLKITPAAVEGWQCMAELMAVTGIGKQYAELLVRSGVSSIVELRSETAQPLLNRIQKLEKQQSNRIQGNVIGLKIVQSWIDAAQAHHAVTPLVKPGV
jgi:predicted flap endonuclease-1-like 5' DNA nuclease